MLVRSMLGAFALASMLVMPLGCANVDESGEDVGEAAEALNTPFLVATPSPLAFGSVVHGQTSTLNVTLTNTGDGKAINITVVVPPDPYRSAHNPPADLNAGTSSNVMQLMFAPTTTGSFPRTVVVKYKNIFGVSYTLNIPVTGTGT